MATTPVSLAKVAVIDSSKVGRSAAYNRYNNGPRTLPWGTQFQPLRGSVCYSYRILG
jgi:hypothetical protein